MAYTSWSVVFGEQPSADKWNTLGTNDSFFNTQVGTNFSSGTTSTVWWEELARTTLSASADTITASSIPARKYLQVHLFLIATGGTISAGLSCNGDTGTNYSRRYSINGAADTTEVSIAGGTAVNIGTSTAAANMWLVFNAINVAAREKLFIIPQAADSNTAGAANAPNRREQIAKWANTAAQISSITITNGGAGDYASGSSIVILGHD